MIRHQVSKFSLAALHIIAVLSTSAAFAGAPPPAFPTLFEVIEIQPLELGEESWAKGVNDEGVVVGLSIDTTPDPDESRPFIFYSATGSLQPISTSSQSVVFGEATSINSSGFAAVTTRANINTRFNGYINFKTLRLHGEPLETDGDVFMSEVNDGFAATGAAEIGGAYHATLWFNGGLADLGVPLGDTNARGLGINDSNNICGASWGANPLQTHAFHWDGNMNVLQTLGGTYAAAFGLNISVIAGFANVTGDGAFHACVWTDKANPPVDFDTLLGATNSAFHDINALNDKVGWSESNGSADHRAVAAPAGAAQLLDLNTLIPPASGWVLREAWDISDKRHIVGVGEFNGLTRGFLLRPIPAFDTIAYFDFTGTGGMQGWTTLANIPPFASCTITDSPAGLVLSPNNQFNAFGIAQSPDIIIKSNVRYRAVFEVSSNLATASDAPQFRLRVGQQFINAAWVANVDSISAAAPGAGQTIRYEFDILPDADADQTLNPLFLAIDLTHFNPADSATGIIYLLRAWLEIAEELPKPA